MIALFITVLVASLVGSLHCAGMCGAFVAFAIGAAEPGLRGSRAWLLTLYQVGRLITYAALGAAAGALGAGIDVGGRLVGMQRAAAIGAGGLMVFFGVLTLLRLRGVKFAAFRVPAALTALVAAGHRQAMRHSPPVRALATGLLTTLLPCGWLYAFVITAAGTGDALAGSLLMASFWVGTLPVLTLLAVGIRTLAAPLAARLPAISACAIVIVGLYTIVARAGITLHGAAEAGQTAAQLEAQLHAVDHKTLPCCVTTPSSSTATAPASPPQPDPAESAPGGEHP